MFVRLLVLAGCVLLLCSAQYNFNVKVSADVKAEILTTDDADEAYNMFLASYEDLDAPAMLMSVDPVTQKTNADKKKNNFVKSLTKAKEHNKRYEAGFLFSLFRLIVRNSY